MIDRVRKHIFRQGFATTRRAIAILPLLCIAAPAVAQDIPSCALTGSMTTMIGGKPALRLADVANCPPDLYDIISSVQIDGQPMVHFKSVVFGKTRCFSEEDLTVTAENKPASTIGDHACTTK